MTLQEKWKRTMADTRASDTYKDTRFQTEIIVQFIHKMREKNISQTQLAEKTGLQKSYLSRVFSSSSNITLATIRKIADALEVNVEMSLRDKHTVARDVESLGHLVDVCKPDPVVAVIFTIPTKQPWGLNGDQHESVACSA